MPDSPELPRDKAAVEQKAGALERGDTLVDEASALRARGNYAAALARAHEAVKIREDALGPSDPDAMAARVLCGDVAKGAGDYPLALEMYGRNAAILADSFGPSRPEVASATVRAASVYHRMGDFETAEQFGRQALRISRDNAVDDYELGRNCNALGLTLVARGAYDEAGSLLDEALHLMKAVRGEDHEDVAAVLNNLAVLRRASGKPKAARALYKQALDIETRRRPQGHPRIARAHSNLAAILHALGDTREAIEHAEEALAIRTTAFGEDHPSVAQNLNNLAFMYGALGDYPRARDSQERALQIVERTLGASHRHTATALANLAALFMRHGDAERAASLLERARAIRTAALGEDHPAVGTIWNMEGGVASLEGDLKRAEFCYRQALAIREAAFTDDHQSVAQTLSNLAHIIAEQGDDEKAKAFAQRTVAMYERVLGAQHRSLVPALNLLAQVAQREDRPQEARELYQRAYDAAEASTGESSTVRIKALSDAALFEWEQGTPDRAVPLLQRALVALDTRIHRTLPALSFIEQHLVLDDLIEPLTSLALGLAHEEPDHLNSLYQVVSGWKGLLLAGLRRSRFLSKAEGGDDKNVENVLERLRGVLRQIVEHLDGATGEDKLLRELEEERERLERRLSAGAPPPEDQWYPGGMRQLCERLPESAAFVDIFRRGTIGKSARRRYTAVITTHGRVLRTVDLGEVSQIDAVVRTWRKRRLNEASTVTTLSSTLWTPIESALPRDVTTVWVAPDAILTRVPWDALPGGGHARYVCTVPSARELLRLHLREDEPPQSIALVGDVDFGGPGRWRPLPASRAELEAIGEVASRLPLPPTSLRGSDATPRAVSEALLHHSFVHIATHAEALAPPLGEASPAEGTVKQTGRLRWSAQLGAVMGEGPRPVVGRSPLSDTVLVLAGANVHGPAGYLSAAEIAGLNADGVRLVTLSACATGQGREAGIRGVYGLQMGVMAAGARVSLTSLWLVDDEATSFFMQVFYSQLWEETLSPAQALREAQQAVRSRPEWSAPMYWAGWTLSGDGFSPL